MTTYHLAQVNIAQAKYSLEDEQMIGFVSKLDEINQLAEASAGFLWRLKTDEGDATSIVWHEEDDGIIVNMSLWQSVESLKTYVYESNHLALLKGKKAWFTKLKTPATALWWIKAGETPTIEMAKAALASLDKNGPTANGFNFAHPVAAPV